jgi:hypothetical protein
LADKQSPHCEFPRSEGIVFQPSRYPTWHRLLSLKACLFLPLLLALFCLQAYGDGPTAPSISAVSPGSVPESSNSTVTVTGANFTPQSVIQVSGSPRATVYVSATQLNTSLTTTDTATTGTLGVSVATPGSGSSAATALNVAATSAAVNPIPPGSTVQYVPHFVEGGGFITKLTLVNLTNSNNQVSINFLGQDGSVVETMSYLLAPAATARIEAPDAVRFGPSVTKWAMVGSQGGLGVNLFFELGSGSTSVTNTVGFNDASPASSLTLPVEFSPFGRTVGLAIANPSSSINHVTLQLNDQNGSVLAGYAVDLPAFGQTSIDLSSIAAFQAVLPAADFVGTVVVTASSPVAAIALGDDIGPFFSTPPLVAGRAGQIVIPHIVSGTGFVTKLTLIDMSGSSNALDVKFYDQSGNLLQDQAVTLTPRGVARISTPEANRFAASQTTWAVVTATNAAAVNLFFELEDNFGRVINVLGFNDAPPATDFTIPVEFFSSPNGGNSGRTVGLALANTSDATATITATLVDQAGQAVATAPLSLAKNTQAAVDVATLPAFKAALPPGNFIGALIISASSPISAIALGDDFGPFYATPIIAGHAGNMSVAGAMSVASILPEVGSSAGGTSVTVTGTGFNTGATVTFGGTPATAVSFVSSTTLRVTTPPHGATSAAAVVVTNPDGGSASLTSGFDYEPAATVTYFSEDFENGTTGSLAAVTDETGNSITPSIQTSFVANGGHSVRMGCLNSGNCSSSRLDFGFCGAEGYPQFGNVTPCNPGAANPNGFYHRFWIMLDQSAIDSCGPNQCKVHLARYNPGADFPWDQTGLGAALGSSTNWSSFSDSGLVAGFGLRPAVPLVAGVWYEMQFHYVRNTATHVGTYTMWINGVKVTSYSDPAIGSDDLSARQTLQIGLVVNESAIGAFNIYVDNVAAADGWID